MNWRRGQGKEVFYKALAEEALNAGKTVVFVTPEGVARHKRHGHLTSITPVKEKPSPITIITDDICNDDED